MWANVSLLAVLLRAEKFPRKARLTTALKVLAAAYFALVTWLLLTAEPMSLILSRLYLFEPLQLLEDIGHFLCFTLLTLLVLIPGWLVPRWVVLGSLVAYAVATELIQTLVPGRDAGLADCLQNLSGIAAGTVGVLLLQLAFARLAEQRNGSCAAS